MRFIRLQRTLILLLLAMALPGAAQDGPPANSGNGVVVEGAAQGIDSISIGSLNPLLCNNDACRRITNFLFPWLVGADAQTGAPAGAETDPNAVAINWEASEDGQSYTFYLRDDLRWSDGQPVTAYDVLYSYLAILNEDVSSPFASSVRDIVKAVIPVDDTTLVITYENADCDNYSYSSIPIIPAHVFDQAFRGTAAAQFENTEDAVQQFVEWLESDAAPDFVNFSSSPFNIQPAVTAGAFTLAEIDWTEHIQLVANNARLGFVLKNTPDRATAVTDFLTGRSNFIENPPYESWEDLLAREDVQAFEYPGNVWQYIGLNLADPFNPQSAFDEEGSTLEQGHHPIFGDVNVRRAFQMTVNLPQIVEAAFQGHATIMPANYIPTAWVYNSALKPVPYNPTAAADLLEAAGWKDTNRDGIRECVGCPYGREGARLSFTLLYPSDGNAYYEITAILVQQQLRQVGFEVSLSGMNFNGLYDEIARQRYDAFMAGWVEYYPFQPDQSSLFTTSGDVLIDGYNFTSYANEEVDRLFEQARALPGCDREARAEIYRQIQVLLQEDQPYIWLFTANNLFAAHKGIQGFAPYPNAPFWNIREWNILR